MDGGERAGQGRHDDVQGAGARDHDGLFAERVEDLVDQPLGHARGLGPDQLDKPAAACSPQSLWGAVAFEQPGDGLVVELGPEDSFQRGVELGEQAADAVGGASGLGGEVLVEAGQDGEFGGDSSVSSSERRVWGMVRAASAMTAASFASVFASPG